MASPIVPWNHYIGGHGGRAAFRDCRGRCAPAFERQRALIRQLVHLNSPGVVACLGAGALNDIPYLTLLRSGAKLHLVDWLPEVIEAGISMAVMGEENGSPRCAYCSLGKESAYACCRSYSALESRKTGVCSNFVSSGEPPPACEAFELGDWPSVHVQDVSGGYALAFVEQIGKTLDGVSSWRQALARATAVAKRLERSGNWQRKLDIPDSSVDLVTSSMLLSQFDQEPYDYFSTQVGNLIGPPSTGETKRLEKALNRLRDTLLERQIEEHCNEIRRILRANGCLFMSFELFHFSGELKEWFLVKPMHKALATLNRDFRFMFEIIADSESMTRFVSGEEPSMVFACVLKAR